MKRRIIVSIAVIGIIFGALGAAPSPRNIPLTVNSIPNASTEKCKTWYGFGFCMKVRASGNTAQMGYKVQAAGVWSSYFWIGVSKGCYKFNPFNTLIQVKLCAKNFTATRSPFDVQLEAWIWLVYKTAHMYSGWYTFQIP
jgi:hypothetical protein